MHRTKLRSLLLSLAVVALDQWSKWRVETTLPLHSSREIIPGFLSLTHVQNTGVAFGLFAARGRFAVTALLAGIGFLALTIVAVYFVRTPPQERWTLAGLGLILGGAVGNLIDRVAGGAVTDFIDFYVGSYHWHTFNVADSAITIGIGLMAIDILRSGGHTAEPAEASSETPAAG